MTDSTQTARLNLAGVSATFPDGPEPEIWRENVLELIEMFFAGGADVVLVDGETGAGRTTLLSQFVKRNSRRALSLFVRGSSRMAYHPDLLRRDLMAQVLWCLDASESEHPATDERLSYLMYDLLRKARRSEGYFFVLDGLNEIPDEDKDLIPVILKMLPTGLPGFRYLITGTQASVGDLLHPELDWRSFQLYNFSDSEAREYLKGSGILKEHLPEIIQLTRRNPGKLSQVRRLLATGTPPDRLLDEIAAAGGLYELEWRKVQESEDETKDILALIAFGQRSHTLESLGDLLELEVSVVKETLSSLNFVVTQQDGTVRFVTDSFASFVREQLAGLEQKVHARVIDRITEEPESEALKAYLADVLFQAKKFDALLAHLSGDQYTTLVDHAESLYDLTHLTQLGYSASEQLDALGDCLRFSAEESIIREVSSFEMRHSEVQARLAVNDYETALALAQASPVDAERLHLLAVIHRYRLKMDLEPEPEIEQQIRQTFQLLGEPLDQSRALEVARDLVHCCPELAISLIEQSGGGAQEDPNSLDWAYAVLTMEAGEQSSKSELAERIIDPEIRQLTTQIEALGLHHPGADFLAGIEEIPSVSSQLFLIRQWLRANPEHEDVCEVVKHGIKTAFQSTDYTLNAKVISELAQPLSAIAQQDEEVGSIIGLIDAQKEAIKELGPIQDYVQLQLALMEALALRADSGEEDTEESDAQGDGPEGRALDCYAEALNAEPKTARLRSLAAVISSVGRLAAVGELDDEVGMLEEAKSKYRELLAELLAVSAEQLDLVRPAITALADAALDEAVATVEALNTQPRRDQGYLTIVQAAADRRTKGAIDWQRLAELAQRITDPESRDEAVVGLIETASGLAKPSEPIETFLPVANLAVEVGDAVSRCKAYVAAIRLAFRTGNRQHSIVDGWLSSLDKAWEAIGTPWRQVDAAFGIARDLAENEPEMATAWIERADDLRSALVIDTRDANALSVVSTRLAMRAYAGLLPREIDNDRDFNRLVNLIERQPAIADRVTLYSDVALRQFAAGRRELATDTVGQKIKPLLPHLPTRDSEVFAAAVVAAAPALYLHHAKTAMEQIKPLHPAYRDEALKGIVHYLLVKHPPSDSYHAKEGKADLLTFEECVDVIDLMSRMDSDALFANSLGFFVRTLDSPAGKKFTTRNRKELARRLEEVIAEILPKPHHISHPGYVILCQAYVLSLKGGSGQEWQNLIKEARDLSNDADRILVLVRVLEKMSTRSRLKHEDAIAEEVLETAKTLPLMKDRMDRLQGFAEAVGSFKRTAAKAALEAATDAVRAAPPGEKQESWPKYRAIIEAAYEIDDELGASMASLAEDDQQLSAYQQRVRNLALRKELQEKLGEQVPASGRPEEAASAAWNYLGGLNARRRRPVAEGQLINWISFGRGQTFSNAYPFLALTIENLNRKWAGKEQAVKHIRPVFEGACTAAEIGQRLIAKARNRRLAPSVADPDLRSESRQIPINQGEWPKAEGVIADWAATKVRDYVKIIDPFFGPGELHLVRLLQENGVDCLVQVVSTMKRQRQVVETTNIHDAYVGAWNDISDDPPPPTEVIVVDVPPPAPVHDRYLLTNGSGLRLGSSLNSLGGKRDSFIERLTSSESAQFEAQVDPYLSRQKRVHQGHRISYQLFTL